MQTNTDSRIVMTLDAGGTRIGVGMSRLGTSEAVAIGAYAFALNRLG